jgi:hypothetical protein
MHFAPTLSSTNHTDLRYRLSSNSMLLLPHEHPHSVTHDLVRQGEFGRVQALLSYPIVDAQSPRQSGQSLIEHSYKADSDLSPAGWEYADRLKAAVMARRKQILEDKKNRGDDLLDETQQRKLVVRTTRRGTQCKSAAKLIFVWPSRRSGPRLVDERTTLLGLSSMLDTRSCRSRK